MMRGYSPSLCLNDKSLSNALAKGMVQSRISYCVIHGGFRSLKVLPTVKKLSNYGDFCRSLAFAYDWDESGGGFTGLVQIQ
jgi:hypothetical protein